MSLDDILIQRRRLRAMAYLASAFPEKYIIRSRGMAFYLQERTFFGNWRTVDAVGFYEPEESKP